MLLEIATIIGSLILMMAIGVVVALTAIVLFMFTGAMLTWLAILPRSFREARKQRDELPSQGSGDSEVFKPPVNPGAILS
jgi:hypothetical protein